MKTIKQLSTEFGISKEAIYKKIKFQLKEELNGHVFKIEGVTHVDGEGERLMRLSLNHERRAALESVLDEVVSGDVVVGDDGESGRAHMNEYVNLLREQVKEKDIQIETQSGHIGQLIRQLGISQMLIGGRRPNEIAATLQPKDQPKDQASALKQMRPAKRNIWKRIFRGKRRKAVQ